MKSLRLFIALVSTTFVIAGCSTTQKTVSKQAFSAEQNPKGITQIELQNDVQRFAGEFNDRVIQAMDPLLKSKDPVIHDRALRAAVLYSSASIEIATGPSAEANLLDMIGFVRLSRIVLEDYWIPHVYGKKGMPLLEAFKRVETRLWEIAGRVLNEEGRARLIALIDQWHKENPEQVRVEFTRFSAYSYLVGQEETREPEVVRGLLDSMKSATASVDSVLLLGERAMFLVQKQPFLFRIQAQLAARDIVSDLLEQSEAVGKAVHDVNGLRPLVNDLAEVSEMAMRAASESRQLAQTIAFDVLPPKGERRPGMLLDSISGIRESLASTERILDRLTVIISEAKTRGPASVSQPVTTIVDDFDRMVRRWFLYLVVLGASWSLFLWGGYFLAKRALNR